MSDRKAWRKAYYEADREKSKAQTKAYREANKERVKEYMKAYAKAWREKNKDKVKAYREANKEKAKEYMKAYREAYAKANRGKLNAKQTQRRAFKLNRTPSWLTKEDLAEIKDIYRMANRRTRVEGIQYHVDHIIPLKGKNISGLHVLSNLQILRARDNIVKGNRYGKD
jgi:hypothetical protein